MYCNSLLSDISLANMSQNIFLNYISTHRTVSDCGDQPLACNVDSASECGGGDTDTEVPIERMRGRVRWYCGRFRRRNCMSFSQYNCCGYIEPVKASVSWNSIYLLRQKRCKFRHNGCLSDSKIIISVRNACTDWKIYVRKTFLQVFFCRKSVW